MNKPDKERIKRTEALILRIHNMGGFDNIGIVKLSKYTGKDRTDIYRIRKGLERGMILYDDSLDCYNKALDRIENEQK